MASNTSGSMGIQAGDGKYYATGGSGKEFVYNPATGNIGVTTTQQMLESERESRKYSTVYEIIGEFKERFCLLVY